MLVFRVLQGGVFSDTPLPAVVIRNPMLRSVSCLQIIKRSQVKVLWQNFHFLSYIQIMGFFLICYFSLHMFSCNFCLMPVCHLYALLKFVLIYLIYVFVFLVISRKIHLNSSIIEVRDSESSCIILLPSIML